MATFNYTRAQLKALINQGIKNKGGMLTDFNETVNEVVREMLQMYDLRGTKRVTPLSPRLFSGIYNYQLPADLKGNKLIDLIPQNYDYDHGFDLNSPSIFNLDKMMETGITAVDEYNGVKMLRISSSVDNLGLTVSELDSITSPNAWYAFGDAINVAVNSDDYISGYGSISYDLSSAGGTTAGIQCTTLSSFDITTYLQGSGAIFVDAYITSLTGLTNFKMRIGNGPSAYYEMTTTTQHDGTAFVVGWNTLRFDLVNYVTVGGVSNINMIYAAVFMTKLGTKISETSYKFDLLSLKRGRIYGVKYYSKYAWIDATTGAYKENATSDLDILAADTDEYPLFVNLGISIAAPQVNEFDIGTFYEKRASSKLQQYIQDNPSEAKIISDSYYDFPGTKKGFYLY